MAAPTSSIKVFANWVTWEGGGIRLSVPGGWQRVRTDVEEEVFAARDHDAEGNTLALLLVERLTLKGGLTTAQAVDLLLTDDLRSSNDEVHERRHLDLPAGGAELVTLWTAGAASIGAVPVSIQIVCVAHGEDYYILMLTTRRSDAESYLPMLAIATESFRIT